MLDTFYEVEMEVDIGDDILIENDLDWEGTIMCKIACLALYEDANIYILHASLALLNL